MTSKGHICLLALLLTIGIVRASQEAAENKDERDDGGRFFFSTTSTGSNDNSSITLTLGVGDILLALLAVALSVAAGVVLAGVLLGNPLDGSTGYTAPTSYGSEGHTAESSYAVLRSLETAARKNE
ncbi:uncharacterized protein LOC123505832 [Portunus trituberculatus]|uniref:uncharacterized protein LOC123505832 n=1 Tax=Portunus trituberculatus TaxID=210409 RepID=UPI001E1CB86E|nr:uncharacterized protein LOC123505832 [Portunus trituberculatus]